MEAASVLTVSDPEIPCTDVDGHLIRGPITYGNNAGVALYHCTVNPNHHTLYLARRDTDQVYIFIQGSGTLCIENDYVFVESGQVVEIPKGTMHMVINWGVVPLKYLLLRLPCPQENDRITNGIVMPTKTRGRLLYLPEITSFPDGLEGREFNSARLGISARVSYLKAHRRGPAIFTYAHFDQWVYVIEGFVTCSTGEKSDHAVDHLEAEDIIRIPASLGYHFENTGESAAALVTIIHHAPKK